MAKYKYKVVDVNGGSFSVPIGSAFYLDYVKNTTVKAPKGSLGIMMFSNLKAAEHFLFTICHNMSRGRVKRVIPIGRKTVPKWVSRWAINAQNIRRFNKIPLSDRDDNDCCSLAPQGTECFPEAIVID